MVYDDDILALRKVQGFIKKYWDFCQDYNDRRDAYEATERMHVRYYHERKYTNWECFKSVLNRHLREMSKKR